MKNVIRKIIKPILEIVEAIAMIGIWLLLLIAIIKGINYISETILNKKPILIALLAFFVIFQTMVIIGVIIDRFPIVLRIIDVIMDILKDIGIIKKRHDE